MGWRGIPIPLVYKMESVLSMERRILNSCKIDEHQLTRNIIIYFITFIFVNLRCWVWRLNTTSKETQHYSQHCIQHNKVRKTNSAPNTTKFEDQTPQRPNIAPNATSNTIPSSTMLNTTPNATEIKDLTLRRFFNFSFCYNN